MPDEKTVPTAPPFEVRVLTDNLRACKLIVSDAEGVAREIVVPNDGNVYQGLHAIKDELALFLNDLAGAALPKAPEAAPTTDSLPATEPEPQA